MKPPDPHGWAFALLALASLFATGCAPSLSLPSVRAAAETEPVRGVEDAADDPAIWVHPTAPESSLVIGTDKDRGKGGLHVFDLGGRRLSIAEDGGVNNVDLRPGFRFGNRGGGVGVIVAASRRTDSTLALYRLDPATRSLRKREARPIRLGMEPYGLCLYRDATGETYVFVGDKEGRFVQLVLTGNDEGMVDAAALRTLKLSSQAEGCVADDETGRLYVAEEGVGLWRFNAAPEGDTTAHAVERVAGNKALKADLEGVALYTRPDGAGYLVVSSQGNNSYAVYDRQPPNRYLTSFRIADHAGIDGVSETDGLEVVSAPLGPRFPKGLLVVQDGDNRPGTQNFKLIDWREVESHLHPQPADSAR